jgi:hypothetical protein
VWEFLKWVLSSTVEQHAAKLDLILMNQHQILQQQVLIKEIIMAVKQTVEQHAAEVNAFSDQLALAIEGIRADISDMKVRLADASTVEEVDAIMKPALDKLKAQADAASALDAENVPSIPVIPPVEPPPEEPPL